MSIITVDIETYYDKDYSLSKMTTEEYINDPRFEVIGVGIKWDDNHTKWLVAGTEEFNDEMEELQVVASDCAILCHNTLFDGAILAWKYGIKPGFWFDTLSMARAIHGVEAGGSLKALALRYGIGEKGDEVINALGKRRVDFDQVSLERYGLYCRNDVDLTHRLFGCLSQAFPDSEYKLIDLTVRMYTEPTLRVDDALLVQRLEQVRADKSALLSGLMEQLGCDTEEAVRKKLSSNPQFADLLRAHGITPPVKLSPTTGKETYALAKTDQGFIDLQEHPDPLVQQLCAVRLGTKSTLEESRIERFIGIGARNRGSLPVPLRYYGAHTGRWSGLDSVNFQNLPSRDKAKKTLKHAIVPPDGHIVINCDSSQIEARVLAWLAGQESLVTQFTNGEDVYSTFASEVYRRPISKANEMERFVGKTCIAEGSLVLCESGWKRIETVTTNDHVWDGEEWVCHSGVVLNGTKETLQIHGLWLTPDHQVWSGTWQRADFLLQDVGTLSQALDTAAANLPLQAIWLETEESGHSSFVATATPLSTRRPVYDILNSGSRNRFTVLTERGPLIVHNCILGLGYGTGAKKLQQTLAQGGAVLNERECKDTVALYRGLNYRIPELWSDCDAALRQMMYSESAHIRLGRTNSNGVNAVWVDTDTGIQLPNGLYIRYPKLRLGNDDRMIYDSRRGPVNIWGGAMVENIVQALARIIVGHQMLRVAERYSVALTVHDAVVCVVSEDEKDAALQWIIECMSTPPDWAEGLPVACEAKWGHTYGEC